MVDLPPIPKSPGTRDEALAWFVRMNSGNATVSDRAAFEAWLSGDLRRQAEYEKLATLWTDLDAVPDPRLQRPAAGRGLGRRRLLMGTATVAIAAASVPLSGLPTVLAADFHTGTGERKEVTTADGIHVELDAGTAIAEERQDGFRRLRLLEGRAMFRAAEDPSRPLEVSCADGVIRTPGGTFVVHKRLDDVMAAAEAGAASVSVQNGGKLQRMTLAPGQCVAYGGGRFGAVEAISDAETAWRRGRLVFQDRPLGDVVADLNRYRQGRIIIAERSLARLRVNGVFDGGRPEAALDALTSTLSLQALRMTDYLVVLRRGAAAS